MKKIILPVILFTAILTSCGSDAVEASDAQAVVQKESNATYAKIDANSNIEWEAWHWGKLNPRSGKVFISEGEVSTKNGELTNGKFVIDISSLTVESFSEADSIKKRDLTGHLKNKDFFLVDSFPIASFEITGVDTTSGDFNTVINGNMTLKGATKNVSFKSNVVITEGSTSIISEIFEINRLDWGLKYKEFDNAIHNNIAFKINVKMIK